MVNGAGNSTSIVCVLLFFLTKCITEVRKLSGTKCLVRFEFFNLTKKLHFEKINFFVSCEKVLLFVVAKYI